MAKEEKKGLFKGVLGQIESFFTMQFSQFWTNFSFNNDMIIGGILRAIEKSSNRDKQSFLEWWSMALRAQGIMEEGDIERMQKMFEPVGIWKNPLVFANIIMLILRSMIVKQDVVMSEWLQTQNKLFRPGLPDINSMIRAGFVAPEKNDEIRENMRKLGMKETDIDLLYIAQYATYPFEVIRQMSLRGVLSQDKTNEALAELGFTPARINNIKKIWEVIPSPQDLFWMVGKEAFEDDIIKYIGLDDEFPAGQVEWLQKQGVNEFWAHKYWYAHWDTPSPQQGFEMFQREVIDAKELDILFRNTEIPPFWREKLTQIAFRPIGRVDLRRIHLMGVIGDTELPYYYRQMGYSPENAEIMAEWTILYNTRDTQELGKSKILQAYSIRAITKEDATELLRAIKISDKTINFLLKLEDFQEVIDNQEDIIRNIRDRFLENLIDKRQAEERLNKLNLSGLRISTLIDRWEVQAYRDRKLPTQTQLDMFFQNDIINADEYQTSLLQAGYSFRLADMFIKLSTKIKKEREAAEKEKEKAEKPPEVPVIEEEIKLPSRTDLDKFFKADLIDEDEYFQGLLNLNYPDEIASLYLELSKLQKEKQQKS